MGQAFGANVLTPTRASGILEDAEAPAWGALNPKAINTPTALGETTGTSVSLVHGDLWDQWHGSHTENIFDDYLLTINKNRTETVRGNHQHTIIGTTNTKHVGVHNHTNIAPRNDTFVHTRMEDHHQPEQKHQPTSLHDVQNSVTAYHAEHILHAIKEVLLILTKVQIVPILEVKHSTLKAETGGIKTQAIVMKSYSNALEAKFQAMVTKHSVTHVLNAALWAKIILFDGNAGVAANADSPFA